MTCALVQLSPPTILNVYEGSNVAVFVNIPSKWQVYNAPIGYTTPDGLYKVVDVSLFVVPPGHFIIGGPFYSISAQAVVTQTYDMAPIVKVGFLAFLERLTDAEFLKLWQAAQAHAAVMRWLQNRIQDHEIDMSDPSTTTAKAASVNLGILTQERADAVFVVNFSGSGGG